MRRISFRLTTSADTVRDAAIVPAAEVDRGALADFYADVFPGRAVMSDWQWLYRTSATPSFPLVAVDGERVVAHAGGIPFTAVVDGRRYRAAWFIDFVARPESQRRGIGSRLTAAWMDQSDVCVTFCNDRSMRLFARAGWTESFQQEVDTIWLRPLAHPRLASALPAPVRAIAGPIAAGAAAMVYHAIGGRPPAFTAVDDAAIRSIIAHESDAGGAVAPDRDASFVSWRVADSPRRTSYRIMRDDAAMLLLRLGGERRRDVDVLWSWTSATSQPSALRRMLASLAAWASAQGFDAVRYMPPTPTCARAVRTLGAIVSRPRFAWWARDPALRERLQSAAWRLHLLDSDFEWI